MKKIFLGLSVIFATLVSAQNYPGDYPTNQNNGYYGDYDDDEYFPDDYYYQYPSDYYTADFYQNYYSDYQRSIYDINWNAFFRQHRLSPWQVQQIVMLNEMYPSFSAWDHYYRYNPDRWYYDRFSALERILGPRIFIVFQNNYYQGYNPVSYYQNYRRQHYAPSVYIVPRYRNINVNRYRVDRTQYHQNNPRQNFGFRDDARNSNSNSGNGGTRGFRDNSTLNQGGTRSGGFGTEQQAPRNQGGFRNDDSGVKRNPTRNATPQNQIKSNSGSERNSTPGFRTNSSGSSAQRFTSR